MEQFFGQFGVDWKLFLAQVINFSILLLILKTFAYKPILSFLEKRREKIEGGLVKAAEAEEALQRAQITEKEIVEKANTKAVQMISEGEKKGREKEEEVLARAEKQKEKLMGLAEKKIKNIYEQEKQKFWNEALELTRVTVSKAVSLKPELIDEALIEEAVLATKKEQEKKS